MRAPSVMQVIKNAIGTIEAHNARVVFRGGNEGFVTETSDGGLGEALAAVAELVAAVEHDFDTRRRVPLAGPQDLQDATDRVAAALAAFGAPR